MRSGGHGRLRRRPRHSLLLNPTIETRRTLDTAHARTHVGAALWNVAILPAPSASGQTFSAGGPAGAHLDCALAQSRIPPGSERGMAARWVAAWLGLAGTFHA